MNRTITPHVLAREDGLGAGEGGKKGGSTAGITVAECLGTKIEPTLGRIANIAVANEEPDAVTVCRP